MHKSLKIFPNGNNYDVNRQSRGKKTMKLLVMGYFSGAFPLHYLKPNQMHLKC